MIRPTPHYPQYLHENTSSRPRRQKSVRTAYAVQPSHASSTDGGAATRSLGASIPAYHPSISLMSPVVDQVAMHNRKRVGLEPSISEEKGRVDISFVIPREEAHSHRRESYENAMGFTVGESTIQIQAASEEEESRCVSLVLSIGLHHQEEFSLKFILLRADLRECKLVRIDPFPSDITYLNHGNSLSKKYVPPMQYKRVIHTQRFVLILLISVRSVSDHYQSIF